MKKLLFVATVAAFTMTSCKKDFVCECDGYEYTMTESKKAAAAAQCEGKGIGGVEVDGVALDDADWQSDCTLK